MTKKNTVKPPWGAAPLGKRVMLVKDEALSTSEGGIVIPENAREKPLIAHIISVGVDVTTMKPGDEVIYASFAGTDFNINGVDVIVVDEEDIMLILKDKN
jgi:chaperonin GroES